MQDRAVRIGIVGCGSVMRGAYMPLIEQLSRAGLAEAVAACDIVPEQRALIREQVRGFAVQH